ncbi:hypothetical protein IAG41_00285 [Sphingomonas sp. JC676]|uniref:hypothetical protein n=1 Tax=Sphingomonas sp. JC676 TaxID=2768065 RepID=UPI001657A250|nr:hypothetical protein [Sphingomonas sp. JC676]MBC9030818.1 hypothetical protein [Sphingomonas sp. JC676]
MADDKTTVVETGGGAGTVIAVVAGIIAILVVAYFLFGQSLLNGDTKKIDADIKVESK